MAQTKFLKVALVGASGVGKTQIRNSLEGKPFVEDDKTTDYVGVSFMSLPNVELQIWEMSKLRLSTSYHKADAFLVVLDPKDPELLEYIQKITEPISYWAPGAKTFFIVNKMDLHATEVTDVETRCRKVIQRLRENLSWFRSFNYSKKIIFYSAKEECERTANNSEAISDDNPIKRALSKHFSYFHPDSEELGNSYHISSRVSPAGALKLLLLFVVFSLAFQAVGGFIGGLEGVWDSIGSFFEAIQSLTDWGVGVTAAAIGLSAIFTTLAGVIFADSGNITRSSSEDVSPTKNVDDQDEGCSLESFKALLEDCHKSKSTKHSSLPDDRECSSDNSYSFGGDSSS